MKTTKLVRVMIVEDQPTFQELAELVLSLDPQFEIVHIAGTGEEALEVLERANPDLILLDFRLPGIDGLETAKRIKEHHPNIIIGMVTAHTEEVLARMAKEAQVKEVIPKASFNLERVQRLVNGTS